MNNRVVAIGNPIHNPKVKELYLKILTGKEMLVIQDVVTSCGCTKVSYSKAPVRSGEKTELTVTYEAEEAEHFNKAVTVYCNSKLSPLKLKIKGEAK